MSLLKLVRPNCKLLQVLEHHASDVTSLDFGAKFYLASVSSDKSIAIWEWTPGLGYIQTEFSPLTGHTYAVTKVLFSPDGNSFVTTSFDANIIHWNLKDGSVINTFVQTNNSGVRSVCFSSKDQLISGGDDGSICVWRLTSKHCDSSWRAHEEAVSTLSTSPDGQLFVSSDLTSQTKVWSLHVQEAEDGRPKLLLVVKDFHELGTNEISFSSKYQLSGSRREYRLASCGNDDNLIKLWSLSYDVSEIRVTVAIYATLESHTSSVTTVRFNNAANLLVSGSMDKTVKLWDLQTLSCVKTLELHSRYVTCVAFVCDDSLLATGSNDKTVALWDMKGNLNLDVPLMFCCSAHSSSLFNKSVENSLVQEMAKFSELDNSINSVDISSRGIVVAGSSDKRIWMWCQEGLNLWTPHPDSPLSHHQYPVHQVEFSSCSTMMASCSLDGLAMIFDIKDDEFSLRGSLHVGCNMRACRFSPDTRLLATGGDDETVTIWRSDDLSLLMKMKQHSDTVSCLSFSLDSKYLISGCGRGNFRVWGMCPCISICLYLEEDAHDLGLTYVEFIPNSCKDDMAYTFLTCGNDALIKVWCMEILSELKAQCNLVRTLKGHGSDVTCVTYIHLDIIASTSIDKTIRFWNQKSGEILHVLDTKEMPLTSCAFSKQKSVLVTGSLDKCVTLWKINPALYRAPSLLQDTPPSFIFPLTEESPINSLQLDEVEFGIEIPNEFLCPITHHVMRDPVICSDGFTYDRSAIELWISSGKNTSPLTTEEFASTEFESNIELRAKITQFIEERQKGAS